MTLPTPRHSLSRRFVRVAKLLVLMAGAAFASLAAALWFWLLPNIADYRQDAAQLMSDALGQRVTLEAISADWKSLRPEVSMIGMRLHDADGQVALHLPRVQGRFSWRSLLFLEPRFSHIELGGLALDVRRDTRGQIFVGGVGLASDASGSEFLDWILSQGEIVVRDANVTWSDALHAAPPLRLDAVTLDLRRRLRGHTLDLAATPPAKLARPVRMTMRFRGADPARWRGTLTMQTAGLSFAALAPWLHTPHRPHAGWASVRLDLAFAEGRVESARAALDGRDLDLVVGKGLPRLRLAHLTGAVSWSQHGDAQTLAVERLRIAQGAAALAPAFDARFEWSENRYALDARDLDLARLARYAPFLPLPDDARAALRTYRPAGQLDALVLSWRDRDPAPARLAPELLVIDAHARALSIASDGISPGVENFSGEVQGSDAAGRFVLTAKDGALYLPGVFREPRIVLDTFKLEGGWKKTTQGLRLRISQAKFSNADLVGVARGDYETRPDGAGLADFSGGLTRADGTRVYRYLPKKVGDLTVNWLKSAILAGGSTDVKFRVKGDLDRFPFSDGSGDFMVDSQIRDGVIDYAPGWPRLDGVDARMLFERGTMRVETRQARIYNVLLHPVTAIIPDLLHREERLVINGIATGPASDFVRFANFSPVGARLRGTTNGLAVEGPMQLALKLDIPLRRSHDTSVSGRLDFLGGRVAPPGLPPLTQVRGGIDFTHDGLDARAINAVLLGGPVRISARTERDTVKIFTQGRVTAQGLAAWQPTGTAASLSGQTTWRGALDLAPDGERLRIESDLVGLASALPAPLDKAAATPLALVYGMQPDGVTTRSELRLGKRLGVAWRSQPDGTLERARLQFGGTASLPDAPGVHLAGTMPDLDLSDWLRRVPAAGGRGGLALASLDLTLDRFSFMGRRFDDVRLTGQARDDTLRIDAHSAALDGNLIWRAGRDARLTAQFKRLALPRALSSTAAATAPGGFENVPASSLPAITLNVDDFSLDGRTLGRLEVSALGVTDGMKIDRLTLIHPDSRFAMSGLWRDGGNGSTHAKVGLQVHDAGKFLARFGLPGAVARGTASFEGELDWGGSPADFSLAKLAGTLDFVAAKGQFLKVEPGAGKLLGIVSLQTLPRRLALDFRDLFSDGYAFDTMAATLRVARGVVYSDDFTMKGPAARVEMSGLAMLEKETVQLRVKVAPKLSDSVSLAGALLGGPIAGVGAFAAQKLLRDPLEAAASREFLVNGPWAAPSVEKIARATARAPRAGPE